MTILEVYLRTCKLSFLLSETLSLSIETSSITLWSWMGTSLGLPPIQEHLTSIAIRYSFVNTLIHHLTTAKIRVAIQNLQALHTQTLQSQMLIFQVMSLWYYDQISFHSP